MKKKRLLKSSATLNTTSKHKNFNILPLILTEIDADKSRFHLAKTLKMSNFSGRWNSKFWGYLCRTSDGSNPEPHKTWLRNIKVTPFSLLSSEKSMLRKRVFSQRNCRKWPISQDVGIQNYEVIYEEQVMAHIQNQTKHEFEIEKFHHFSTYPQRNRCCENAISASENAENDQFLRTLEFKILMIFMKNKWWLTSRTTQNTTTKHKNFTIFLLSWEKSMLRKRVFSQRKRRKW
jgi:hypothetical protein